MARILFDLDIAAPPVKIRRALSTEDGIKSWWTQDATFGDGETPVMTLGFPIAPMPFEVRLDEASDERVHWTSVGDFPPHWAGTEITWTLTATENGTNVLFNHDGWTDDEGPFAMSAYTWGQLMGTLKSHCESGASVPMFHNA